MPLFGPLETRSHQDNLAREASGSFQTFDNGCAADKIWPPAQHTQFHSSDQEAEHPVRVPRLPPDLRQPSEACAHHHPEAVGQAEVPRHKPVGSVTQPTPGAGAAPPGRGWASARGTRAGC